MFTSSFSKRNPSDVVAYCNDRLITWYRNALNDFGVVGNGSAIHDTETDEIVITFTEDGTTYQHREEFWQEEAVDYTFNVWSEQPQMILATTNKPCKMKTATANNVKNALSFIKDQTGLSMPICDLNPPKNRKGIVSFNLELKDSGWMSPEYTALEKLAKKYPTTFTMQDNGHKRVFVTYKN